jgi:hypothetical protein
MRRHRPWILWSLPLAGFLAVCFLAGCPWSPGKNPVIPPPPSHYLPQTSPKNVMTNLQMSYGERNIDEYKKLFAEDFTFLFNPQDPVDPDHPPPPSGQWGLVDELAATENMFKDDLVTKIELTSYSLGDPEPADSLYYGPRAWRVQVDQANLMVATRTESGDLLTLVVEGKTEVFYFREEPSKPIDGRPTWYIFRWEDWVIGTPKLAVAAASGIGRSD